MMRLHIILLLIVTVIPSYAGDDDKSILIRENRLIEEELNLARKSDIYFFLNLNEKSLRIKSRGIALQELPIQDVHCWGSPVSVQVYRLQTKSTFFKPDREMIRPGESKKDNFEIDALELSDMPSRFTLVFDRGLKVSIRPATAGVLSGAGNIFHVAAKFIVRPISMLWHMLRGKAYTTIDMVLDENDARAVYWSVTDGSGLLIYSSP